MTLQSIGKLHDDCRFLKRCFSKDIVVSLVGVGQAILEKSWFFVVIVIQLDILGTRDGYQESKRMQDIETSVGQTTEIPERCLQGSKIPSGCPTRHVRREKKEYFSLRQLMGNANVRDPRILSSFSLT